MQKKHLLPLLFPVQIVLVRVLAMFPGFVERYYSNGWYPVVSQAARWLLGWIPFSFGDVLYGLLILLGLRWFWQTRRSWKTSWVSNLRKITAVLSVAYFVFHAFWAMNYYRVRLPEKLGIDRDYGKDELLSFTHRLIAATNALHLDLTASESLAVAVPYQREEVFAKSIDAYRILEKEFPDFHLGRPSVKKSLISLPLSYMGFSGYLNPFTNEAQVNGLSPLYSFGGTTCHEMAHQIGYASESEANFVGYLAAESSDDPYLRYSGLTLALKYCLRNVAAYDRAEAKRLLDLVNPGVRENFEQSRRFWESHETFLEDGFKFFYDHFLKMNRQDEGLESYNRFVDLLVNYYKEREI